MKLSEQTGAIFVRVDVIEAALQASRLKNDEPEDAGYLAASAVAQSNLLLGHSVIADTVNPLQVTRDLWANTARLANASLLNIEIVCSDEATHRKRVETRHSDIEGFSVPSWQKVVDRTYEAWIEVDLRIDTFSTSLPDAIRMIRDRLEGST